jgi:predicted RNA-binding Zn-ribbon protein involved in translation (DUF1610 family)
MPDRPFESLGSLRAGRETDDDARLQRLADLSIEIRMLKARAQAAMEQRQGKPESRSDTKVLNFRTALTKASCPHCGHTAGLALVPREYREQSTLVRCFACHQDASALDWTVQTSLARAAGSQPHR